ncbi:hypothetical protein OU798_04510 [Prolixibacteraceae bacterium Z1-6]|uniref:Outer membrane protein beta-barrel domain-containing protein n=1 Tax=Draconibacterium aestuarii TaxID=2998507 RepID=A0A9X3F2Y8_9BACT|nr:hypothetical protein [Prolixibacteraceae bacterium Z1-6]
MKFITLVLSALFISAVCFAQVQDTTVVKEPVVRKAKIDKSKLYYGGYLNLSIGNYTVIGATPLVGYKVTPQFSVGGQLSYEYVKDKRYDTDYETSNYGLSVFSRYRIVPQLYVHAEFSEMNYKLYDIQGRSERVWVPFLWLGGGYSQPVTKNTWLNVQVLFDVINDENSPYKDWEPYFSVGFGVGF